MARNSDYKALILTSDPGNDRRSNRDRRTELRERPPFCSGRWATCPPSPTVIRRIEADRLQPDHLLHQRHHSQAPSPRKGSVRGRQHPPGSAGARRRLGHLVPARHPPRLPDTSRSHAARDGRGHRQRARSIARRAGRSTRTRPSCRSSSAASPNASRSTSKRPRSSAGARTAASVSVDPPKSGIRPTATTRSKTSGGGSRPWIPPIRRTRNACRSTTPAGS